MAQRVKGPPPPKRTRLSALAPVEHGACAALDLGEAINLLLYWLAKSQVWLRMRVQGRRLPDAPSHPSPHGVGRGTYPPPPCVTPAWTEGLEGPSLQRRFAGKLIKPRTSGSKESPLEQHWWRSLGPGVPWRGLGSGRLSCSPTR